MPLVRRHSVRHARNVSLSRAWLIALALAVAIPAGVWAALQQLKASRGWMAVAAAASAVAPLLVTAIRQARSQTTERNALLSRNVRLWAQYQRMPKVSDIIDPVPLGVKPATAEPDTQMPWVPSYVPREVDERLDQMLAFSRFVLLVGDSAAGKSRTAFEAMRRRFPDRAIVIPVRAESLAIVLDAGLEFFDSVIWLDDLDTYLGTNTFTLTDLERIIGSDKQAVTVLATIRKAAYDRFDQDAAISERKLLRAAAQLPMHRQLTRAEQATAEAIANSDAQLGVVLHRLTLIDKNREYGLAEYLAAAPELIRRFDHADDVDGKPIGAAVVRAAIDWRRVGLTRPIPAEALLALCPLYLQPSDANQLDDSSFNEAIIWATQKVIASSALLAEEEDGYRVFDYLLDYVERDARFLLPPRLLERLQKLVAPEEAHRVVLALNETYRQTGQEAALAASQQISGRNLNTEKEDFQVGRDVQVGRDFKNVQIGGAGGIVQIGNYNVQTVYYDDKVAALDARGLLLPPDIVNFTGRDSLIEAALNEIIDRRVSTIVFSGLGGIGKTATAIHLGHVLSNRNEFDDTAVYVRLREEDRTELDPADIIADILAIFGTPGRELRTADLGDLVAMYRKTLADRSMVFVIDDAASEQQLTPLLPPPPNVALVTSRFALQLDSAIQFNLTSMTSSESLAFLDHLIGDQRTAADPTGAEAIVLLMDGLPLALRIAGAMLREKPRLSLSEYASELAEERGRLDDLSSQGMTVKASFELSYRELPGEEARAFRYIGLLPNGEFTVEEVMALLDRDRDRVHQLLEALIRASLLRSTSPDSYQMHDLLRLFALEVSGTVDAEADIASAVRRLSAVRSR
jgi:NB-ARC domain